MSERDMATTVVQWNGRPLMRYRVLVDDERFGLSAGDIILCEEMHWAWADEKVASVRRESDGYQPGCSLYREMVEYIGEASIEPAASESKTRFLSCGCLVTDHETLVPCVAR